MLKYIYAKKNAASITSNLKEVPKNADKTFKNDFFYKFCLRFDMPLL